MERRLAVHAGTHEREVSGRGGCAARVWVAFATSLVIAASPALAAPKSRDARAQFADADKDRATTYAEYARLADRAESRGPLGVVGLAAGGALVAGGIVWYVTRKLAAERTLTTFVVPSGAGVALSGRF